MLASRRYRMRAAQRERMLAISHVVLICGLAGTGLAAGDALAQAPKAIGCPGYSQCPEVDYFSLLQNSADARRVLRTDISTEAQALDRFRHGGLAPLQAKRLLGELEIYDQTLSVNRNEACASCHTQANGFTGGIGIINRENVAFLGSTSERSSKRKPMSYAYAPFAPVLHYRASTGDFVGGNFWDMRATGLITGNPAGDQALDPPLTTTEMDNSDPACVIYRISIGPYRDLFRQVWGGDALRITWPAGVDKACAMPLSNNSMNPQILHLSPADRMRATNDYKDFGLAAAAYEAGPQVSPFSSKFDAWQAGKAQLTPQEMRGFKLFTGRGHCDQCHTATGKHPLFTDFTAQNLGIPRNPDLPFLHENVRDPYGYVANRKGPANVDNGVGAFLQSAMNTNPAWKALAPKFVGTFQVATARNTDRRPYPTFQKAYMHNGYFKTLKQVVHFYNTRDVLARCKGDPQIGQDGAGTTCWPAPEQPANENMTQLGNLGLTSAEEDDIVAFLGTLSDGPAPGEIQ